MRYLLVEFERAMRRLFGVDRVEQLLQPFGLMGSVEADVKRDIREMHFVRNVIVHRASTADRRIVEGCPWMKLTIGQRIVLGTDMYIRDDKAISGYCTEIVHRINAKFGIDSRMKTVKAFPTC